MSKAKEKPHKAKGAKPARSERQQVGAAGSNPSLVTRRPTPRGNHSYRQIPAESDSGETGSGPHHRTKS